MSAEHGGPPPTEQPKELSPEEKRDKGRDALPDEFKVWFDWKKARDFLTEAEKQRRSISSGKQRTEEEIQTEEAQNLVDLYHWYGDLNSQFHQFFKEMIKKQKPLKKRGLLEATRPMEQFRARLDFFKTQHVLPLYQPEALLAQELLLKETKPGETFTAWRKLAKAQDCPDKFNIFYLRNKGFTVKETAPTAGQCYDKFQYLQNWNFPDTPTTDGAGFFIPRLAKGSVNHRTEKQLETMNSIITAAGLPPPNPQAPFGSIEQNVALILGHFKTTDERIPLDHDYARADTIDADGYRLVAGSFGGDGLDCYSWDEDAGAYIGFFLQGVRELGR